MTKWIVVILIVLMLAAAAAWWLLADRNGRDFPAPSPTTAPSVVPITPRTHAATGFSTADNAAEAVREALAMARKGLGDKTEGFAFVAATAGYDLETVRDELDRLLPPGAKVHGLLSAADVMTEKGYHKGNVGALAILLVSSDSGIRFGAGAVDGSDSADLETLGERAMRQAVADAGVPDSRRPDFVLYAGVQSGGGERKILDGIAKVVGKNVPVLGGNVGLAPSQPPSPFTRDALHPNGLVLTALYTDRTIGWALEYGFRATETTGKVTKASPAGDVIYEIDDRAALDVYNEWLNGKLLPIVENEPLETVIGYTACNPVGYALKAPRGAEGEIIVTVIPTRKNLQDRALPVYAEVPEGTTIRLLAGRWQTLLNRAEQAVVKALLRGTNRAGNIEFGLFNFCWAASRAIPPSELPKLPLLVRNQIPHTPFLGLFTKGQQGPLPGVRNIHCNLAAAMLLVEQEDEGKTRKEPKSVR
ncbi:MAG: FIST C-terminal domain-containing protein [Phycisphaerae bacterium]|nr:FIST C-terminal domain-containing protein [Phycisphaerae bacterium]